MPDFLSLLVFCAWFAGGFVSGVSGIGGALVAVPVAAMFIPMHEVIPLSCLLNVVMDGCIACMHFRHCRVSALWPMLVGSLPGAFAGLFILQIVSGSILQGGVGALLLYYVYWQSTFKVKQTHPESWTRGGAAGFGAGLLGTAISFDGPPIGAYGLYVGWSPRVFLGTLGVFFVLRGTMTCVLQASAGMYTPALLDYAMYGVPATMLGTLCAFPVVKRINVETFRRVLTVVIALAGLVCLGRSLF
ncbi:sulfite exporter TauE/SafE family protein [Pseudodesulfovibrio tunisiensis]|uniref:sulfite exporter TauE/SafE family protein n=1 Tax=Pseudodesulfovibrio tunisiensis TaxID=463192 RepID=UPI001FB51AA7|nr:sulfite exporter TauE/SafE family protein [Pseudodesulfovibrio tunisiensis]